MKWDCDLERFARTWTLSCPTFPVPAAKMPAGSQLAREFIFDFHGTNATEHIDDSMRAWWLEYKQHGNIDYKNRYSSRQNYYGWANMAKGKTSRIGCSYIICDQKRAIFTCAYSAKAHNEKRMIYEPGQPCGVDDDCSTYPNSRCIPSLGLCQAPKPPSDKNANRMCGALNTTMTDYSRKISLELHNFYRSRLARGLEFDGETNSLQQGAKNMIKLEYDCDLEKYAQAWADGCRFEHSNSWERPNQGQNLYMTTIRNWETSALLHTALEIWWKELEEYGMPSDAILSEEVWAKKGRLIGHFTQMACGKTRRLGCAIATCSDMEYVVCHYSPA
ncbi:SCP-like protein [Oesophagostomum dentatum]|uniref:SCP-like protein n=1 Tax=Oesophagostomum dentatum TaxID=61180 RepID=A0A0B1T0V7_OESDE|nr:SCP-like protein [Oesophagostomum dentatum]